MALIPDRTLCFPEYLPVLPNPNVISIWLLLKTEDLGNGRNTVFRYTDRCSLVITQKLRCSLELVTIPVGPLGAPPGRVGEAPIKIARSLQRPKIFPVSALGPSTTCCSSHLNRRSNLCTAVASPPFTASLHHFTPPSSPPVFITHPHHRQFSSPTPSPSLLPPLLSLRWNRFGPTSGRAVRVGSSPAKSSSSTRDGICDTAHRRRSAAGQIGRLLRSVRLGDQTSETVTDRGRTTDAALETRGGPASKNPDGRKEVAAKEMSSGLLISFLCSGDKNDHQMTFFSYLP